MIIGLFLCILAATANAGPILSDGSSQKIIGDTHHLNEEHHPEQIFLHSSNSTTINFDDIIATNGVAKIHSPYHNLEFSAFSIIAPNHPALRGRISENDRNSAVSAPNALIGSRYHESNRSDDSPASFGMQSKSKSDSGLLPYFDLLTFWIKPLDAPPPGTTIHVRGHRYDYDAEKKPLEWHVDFIVGYHEPFLVKIEEFSGKKWDKLKKVEMWANFGLAKLDWEFCVDDLEVQFYRDEAAEL
ncbi:hypothetical protein L228DRAFT_238193 [Xylona heveae TC161]|uniref:Uncharacterized protein n=1 Tax=Xylona heveae (strain CBS 132557 / TC161) TaxID=1328760 RepID=A0A165HKP1_XYLHT|nr:hypothetical protein L228DRAFT_238193 [Xylona heveae TC161]KZF23656.1 hypothetical protein L228DRAFT_238193 [Xylona heveae TC161]